MDLAKYAALFVSESREHLQSCNQLLLAWERDPEATRQLMERLDAYDLRRRGFNPWTGSVRINP